ncbi:DNA polymerase III subunit gamma/tau [Treponema sp.]|uniref:DNA polymerase III subunit gamma/tau n=1 Tax=Treponema sp. TaxID=166 RepID=UPI001D2FCF5E|nr:DNA polymerase III subunit gamma/tau [Treponema sp.]MBS7242594.1 DNA polymerase III subunit gamma/tau [Treponema sp.]MCI6442065.1 DNA polymerase III subunit gamma/tau [Spirochaetia bacterium]MDY4131994.1 DNA polymerase III subunit gamma/tau [Treponema sp.]
MAYEVTATRRRPQTFSSLVGQEFVAETLKNSIQSGKIANAYLFSGPRGCGKTSTARILAKALNCQKGPTATPCGECDACREITAGSSLDVFEIDGASNNSVDGVRQIKDEVLFPPQTCRYKIYIIDEVHMLSNNAFNALLKTIEEPPPHVVFIFATTELQKVPATIKSRCQQFNYRLVPVEKVKEQLAQAAAELGIKAQDEALYWIAREAGGSMRDSYTLFDQVAAFSGDEITYEKIRDKLGLVGIDRLNELFGLCVKGDSTNVLLKFDEYLQNGVSIEQLISNCTDYLRSILFIKSGIKREALLGQSAERYSADVINAWSTIQVERALSIFMQLYRDIRYSLSPRYEFELALSRMCWLKDYVSAQEVKKAVDAVKPVLMNAAGPRKLQAVAGGNGQSAVQSVQQGISERRTESPVQTSAPVQENSIRKNTPVNGLPTFSALTEESDDVPDESEAGSNIEEEFDPFLNGGAEPPVNNSAMEPAKPVEVAVPEVQEVQPEKNAALKTVDSSNIGKVRDAMISDFSLEDAMISNSLSETCNWQLNGDRMTMYAENNFVQVQLSSEVEKISAYLSEAYGRKISIEIKILEKKETEEKVVLPKEVEVLCDVFRGSLLGSQ